MQADKAAPDASAAVAPQSLSSTESSAGFLDRRSATVVFLAFAFAYFLSSLVRGITATLSPVLTQDFSLQARDLGLLAGGYFLGFALTQLPLGSWLDRYGPKRVILSLMVFAALGCLAFSMATQFTLLLLARVLIGVGVSACLMAPLTAYRRWLTPATLLRSNSWMLMSGSLGLVASTLPVQWLLPQTGWRPLFWALALLILLSIAIIVWRVPRWGTVSNPSHQKLPAGYAAIWAHPYFRKLVPMGFFCYGGLVAMQTLWVTPWMIKIAGYTALQAAIGLFWINVAMLVTFWLWGLLNPSLARRGISTDQLLTRGMPISFFILAIIVIAGNSIPYWSAALFCLYLTSCTVISLSQPAAAMAFPAALAGRALSAYNLVIFVGVFVIQWGVGLMIDGFRAAGLGELLSFQLAFGVYLACGVLSYLYFVTAKSHNQNP